MPRANPYALVLGVAQDGGHPQPGCQAACCVGPGVTPHLTTSIAVIDATRAWLLDAGPDLPGHLAQLNNRGLELAGILLTHAHIGHYTGLTWLGKEAMNTSALPVWAAPQMARFLESNGPWNQLISTGNIDLRHIAGIGELSAQLTAEAFPVPHRDEYSETVGFRVAGPAASLLYVPDTDGWDGWQTSIEEHLETVDIAFVDGTFFSGDELPMRDISKIPHPTVAESMRRFGALGAGTRRKIHFTHLNHTNPLLRSGSPELAELRQSGLAVASEGQEVEL